MKTLLQRKYNNLARTLFLFILAGLLSACTNQEEAVDKFAPFVKNAQNMEVKYQVKSNTAELQCQQHKETGDCYSSALYLTFSDALPNNGWYILFSHLSPIQKANSEHFVVERLNGDLHKLSPIKAIQENTKYKIELVSQFWSVSSSDVLPNYFIVFDDNKTAVIQSTVERTVDVNSLPVIPHEGTFSSDEQVKRNSSDKVVRDNPQTNFTRNAAIHSSDATDEAIRLRIIPQIQTIKNNGKYLNTSNGLSLHINRNEKAISNDELDIAQTLLKLSDQVTATKLTININSANNELDEEAYEIRVDDEQIHVDAKSNASAFYALVSISQLLDDESNLPQGIYKDSPKFSFRGVHLDVGRNFRSVEFVKRLVKQMALLKLNKLHLHLADDEGWRLEIKGLEELTQIGAFRCFDLTERTCLLPQLGSGPDRTSTANGYYSRDDYISILQYAHKHHVEVIPSLDMPGHSRAAVKSMEARYHNKLAKGDVKGASEYLLTDFDDATQYSSVQHYNDNTINPCLASTYRFVEKVLAELTDMHNTANVQLERYHIGADETAGAWHESPQCRAFIAETNDIESVEDLSSYFIGRVAKLVENKGVIAGGWSDGMKSVNTDDLAPMQVNIWDGLMWGGHQSAYDFAQNGWRTILSFPDVLYFDFPYAVDPNEPGYYWATRATDTYKVFQFIPDYPSQNARLWLDRMGQAMQVDEKVLPDIKTVGLVEGIQAHLWSEVVRHDKVAEYMYFPRLLSVAENAWAIKPWQENIPEQSLAQWLENINRDWVEYSAAVTKKVLPRLVSQGVHFRLPPPGAKFIDGKWHLNHLFKGMRLQYKTSSSKWMDYETPIELPNSELVIRANVPNTERYSNSIRLLVENKPTLEEHNEGKNGER